MELAIPMAMLLSVIMVFSRLGSDSELIALRAGGISLYQLLPGVLIFSTIVTGVAFFTVHIFKPHANQRLTDLLFEIASTKSTIGLSPGVFNKLGDITLYSEEIDFYSGYLKSVLVDDHRSEDQRKIIIAKQGALTSDADTRDLLLKLEDGQIHEISRGKIYNVTNFNQNHLAIPFKELSSGEDKKKNSPRELSFTRLRKEIRQINDETAQAQSQQLLKRLNKLEAELYSRSSMPFASFVFALIAMPLGVGNPRQQKTWGLGLSFAFGVLIFLMYFALLTIFQSLAEKGIVAYWIAAWIPNLAILTFGYYIFKMIAQEKWSSAVDRIIYRNY